MQLSQRYFYHKIYRFFNTELRLFELSIWLHVLARSMIAIFIPIFLLKMGYSIAEVMLYYFIFNVFDFPLNFFAGWLTRKIGARYVIILGSISLIAFFAVLYNLTFNNWPLLIIMALFAALYDALYWVAHIYFFIKCEKNDDNISGGLGLLYILKRIAGVLAPIFGALILIFFKQQVLILTSIVILALSIWPLLKVKHTHDKPSNKSVKLKDFFKKWGDVKEYVLQGLCSFHNVAEGIIWPIFIFTLFKTFESVALIAIIVSITTIIFTYFTGKIKKADRNKIIALGSLLIAIVWILRLVIDNNIFYYVSVFLVGLFSVLVSLPLDSSLFEKGERKDALNASTYRNIFSMFPRIFFYGILFLLLSVFEISFLVAAISMFVVMAINYVFILKSNRSPKQIH